jgi:hypothetical protein
MNCLYTIQATGTATKFSSFRDGVLPQRADLNNKHFDLLSHKTLLRFAIEGLAGTVTSIIRHAEDAKRGLSSVAS